MQFDVDFLLPLNEFPEGVGEFSSCLVPCGMFHGVFHYRAALSLVHK